VRGIESFLIQGPPAHRTVLVSRIETLLVGDEGLPLIGDDTYFHPNRRQFLTDRLCSSIEFGG